MTTLNHFELLVMLLLLLDLVPEKRSCGYLYIIYNSKPCSSEVFNLNFQSLEVVSRYRDLQLQVTENYLDLYN